MVSPRFYKAEGIVIRRRTIGESDRILTLFTKEFGKITVIAKGIRRITSKRAPLVEIFSRISLLIHKGKTWVVVSEVRSLDNYNRLRTNLRVISVAYYICELLDGLLPEKAEHRDIYALLIQTLQNLNLVEDDAHMIGELFSQRLLQRLGYVARDHEQQLTNLQLYIERIIEKRLKTPKFMAQLG